MPRTTPFRPWTRWTEAVPRTVRESMFLFSLLSNQALAVLAAFKHVEFVEGRMTRLVGNALRVHGSDEPLGGDFRKLLFVHMEDIGVPRCGYSVRPAFAA